MTSAVLYLLCGGGLFLIGLYGVARRTQLLHQVLALNVMGSGVFMVLLALSVRSSPSDAVPQALVLTGIVVAISATALALALIKRLQQVRPLQAVELDEETS
jgi:multicomponent Na+:H+ antiporter subunit C